MLRQIKKLRRVEIVSRFNNYIYNITIAKLNLMDLPPKLERGGIWTRAIK